MNNSRIFTFVLDEQKLNVEYTNGDLPETIFDQLIERTDSEGHYYVDKNEERIIFSFDSEFSGLVSPRDELRVVQLYDNINNVWIVNMDKNIAPVRLRKVMESNNTKIGHYVLYDLVMIKTFIKRAFEDNTHIRVPKMYDTKILSYMARRYTSRHGYKTICQELLGIQVNKDVELDFGENWAEKPELLKYVIVDTLHLKSLLYTLMEKLDYNLYDLYERICQELDLQSELVIHQIGMGVFLHNYDNKRYYLVYDAYN